MKEGNLNIWSEVEMTPPEHVSAPTKGTKGLSSISAYYVFKRATEVFGPCGCGWGFEEVSESYETGAPILNNAGEIAGSNINHILKINFWYMRDGKKCNFPSVGSTKYIGSNKYGLSCDEEAPKKSLTDAVKKALSMLGFSSDVYMGKYDDNDYKEMARIKSEVERAEDREAEIEKHNEEIKDLVERNISTIGKIDNDAAKNAAVNKMKRTIASKCKAIGVNSDKYLKRLDELLQEKK